MEIIYKFKRGGVCMVTVENVMEHLNNNPEEKELVEELTEYFFPLWLSEKSKQYTIESLPKEDIDFMSQVILLTSISKKDIEAVKNELNFQKVVGMFTEIKNGNNDLISEIRDVYSKNVECTINEYEKEIKEYMYNKLPKKKKNQVKSLKEKGKEEIADKVINSYCKSHKDKCQKINKYMSQFKNITSMLDIDIFSYKALRCNPQLVDTISYAVCYPKFLMPALLDDILNNTEEIPCRWYLYRNLTLSDYKEFTKNCTKPETWNKQYSYAVDRILKNMKAPLIPIKRRVHLVNDIFANINEKRFDSALIIIFSVIEGMLWDLTKEINKIKKIYVTQNDIYDCDKKCNFQSKRIRDILERTYAKEYLDEEFLKEFCNELYEERNPVLHGGQICNECSEQGICILKKIFTLDYIIDRLISIYQENLFQIFDEMFDRKKIDEFLELYRKSVK